MKLTQIFVIFSIIFTDRDNTENSVNLNERIRSKQIDNDSFISRNYTSSNLLNKSSK